MTYLEGQVCTTADGGGFHGYPSTYGGCATNSIGGDVDTTGAVSQALAYYAAATGNATAKTAAENANGWLDHEKAAAGSTKVTWKNFCQTPFTSLTPSVNSTGLAIEGLVDDPRGPSHFATDVTKGTSWLVSAQNATVSSPTDGSLPACTASGPGSVRATAQGTQGWPGSPGWTSCSRPSVSVGGPVTPRRPDRRSTGNHAMTTTGPRPGTTEVTTEKAGCSAQSGGNEDGNQGNGGEAFGASGRSGWQRRCWWRSWPAPWGHSALGRPRWRAPRQLPCPTPTRRSSHSGTRASPAPG